MLFISDSFAAATDALSTDNGMVGGGVPTAESMMSQSLLMLFLLFIIFYFLLIRPQQKKFKDHQALIKGLAKGQKVITTGGMIGTVTKLDDEIVVLEVAQGVKVQIARSAIAEIAKGSAANGSIANDN